MYIAQAVNFKKRKPINYFSLKHVQEKFFDAVKKKLTSVSTLH